MEQGKLDDFKNEYNYKYNCIWLQRKIIPEDFFQKMVEVCQTNPWIKVHGFAFEDDPVLEMDSPYTFYEYTDVTVLERFFEHGNWAIRQGVLYKDLFFVNQVNGGDEWMTAKYDAEKDKFVSFESITMRRIIKRGKFMDLIHRLNTASLEDCVTLNY